MQSTGRDGSRVKTPFKHYIGTAHTPPLLYGVRAPRLPGPEQYAPAWEVPEELAIPEAPRALRQIYHFKDLGQDLQLSCYKYFLSVSPELAIDWRVGESSNVRLPAHEVLGQPQDREVDDMRSFLGAIYQSIIVTAMEMARLIYGGPYRGSYRYSRESTVNLVRGARWDVLPYAKPEAEPDGTQMSQEPKEPEEPRMVAICIPPWNLSSLDLQDFASPRTLDAGELDLTPGEMRISKAHILWSIVYEACKRAHCSYFIVTTYDYWVFGNMSKHYTVASVSSVLDFSERSGVYRRPNILQLVTYWELLSIGAVDWDIPLDDEDVVDQG